MQASHVLLHRAIFALLFWLTLAGAGTAHASLMAQGDEDTVPVAFTAVGAGTAHTCALTSSGGVLCWGFNERGQLGDGTAADHWTPMAVTGLAGGINAVAVGPRHACALTTVGGLKCWGDNYYGQLGDGSLDAHFVPGDVYGLSSGIQAAGAGFDHTCALTVAGGVKCWGNNAYGQLGDGTTLDHRLPTDVSGLTTGVQAIAVGSSHTCALTTAGAVQCWGRNERGQLGDGRTADRATPTDVIGLSTGIRAIAAGNSHTCALATTGAVKCWGWNERGQLGEGTTADRWTPTDVSGLGTGSKAIAAGYAHTCALSASDRVRCWGSNEYAQLGDGTTTNRTMPVDVRDLAGSAETVATGGSHTCALLASGAIQCWGANDAGQLGIGTAMAEYLTPTDVNGLTSGVKSITIGVGHSCAVTTVGGARCWGWNEFGQLGDNTTLNHWAPADVTGLTTDIEALRPAWLHTCALTAVSGIKCWGANSYGQLGDGTTFDRLLPVDVSGFTTGAQAVSTGNRHTCALTAAGGIKCWGANSYGQLGDGTTIDRWTPVDVIGLTSGVQAVSAGGSHTCALTIEGSVKCWGYNGYGQLGDGWVFDHATPVDVTDLASGVRIVASGGTYTCALTVAGGVKCWGLNDYGQLGDGTNTRRYTPADVSGLTSDVQAIATGDGGSVCALTSGGGVKCWGANYSGQVGDGTIYERRTPVDVSGLTAGIQAIARGGSHTCALTTGGGVKCWGSNRYGQLGINPGWTPVDVLAPTVDAVDAAALASQSPNVTVPSGVMVDLWFDVRNTGTTTWSSMGGYRWEGGGEWQGYTGSPAVPVAPGRVWPFRAVITPPSQFGTYLYSFALQHDGVSFGPIFSVAITVYPALTATIEPTETPTPIETPSPIPTTEPTKTPTPIETLSPTPTTEPGVTPTSEHPLFLPHVRR